MARTELLVLSFMGTITLRDADRCAVPDMPRAARAAMLGGSTGGDGRMTGVAGGALLIRCVDRLSVPALALDVHESPPLLDREWTWLDPEIITLTSGVLTLDPADGGIDVGAPGHYKLLVGHSGRSKFLADAERLRGETHAGGPGGGDEAAWRALQGVERYTVHLWPVINALPRGRTIL